MMSKKNGKNKNRGEPYMAKANPLIAIPTTMKLVLHSCYHFSGITTGSDTVFYLNDAFDPFGTSGAAQGYRFDQLAGLYNRVFVSGARYRVSLVTTSAEPYGMALCLPAIDDASLAAVNVEDLVVRPNAHNVFLVDPVHSTLFKYKNPLIEGSAKVKDYYEYKDWQDAEDLSTTVAADTNLRTLYLHFVNHLNATLSGYIEFWQDAVFFSPKNASAS